MLRRRSLRVPPELVADSPILACNRRLSGRLPQYWPPFEEYQYDRNKLSMQEVVGEGQFGTVYLAKAEIMDGEEELTTVAVKTTKEQSAVATADFMKELSVMMAIQGHPNIISLLGVCTTKSPLYIIMELMSEGDLENFLCKARPDKCNPIPGLTPYDLVDICKQVSGGLAYMASRGFIHCDIAARNCLVAIKACKLVVKLSDFGLARSIYQRGCYGGILSLQRMATETVFCTMMLDVWMFGLLMVEVFSFGYSPLYNQTTGKIIFNDVAAYHLFRGNCPLRACELITACWIRIPAARITAAQLETELQIMARVLGSRSGSHFVPAVTYSDMLTHSARKAVTDGTTSYFSSPA